MSQITYAKTIFLSWHKILWYCWKQQQKFIFGKYRWNYMYWFFNEWLKSWIIHDWCSCITSKASCFIAKPMYTLSYIIPYSQTWLLVVKLFELTLITVSREISINTTIFVTITRDIIAHKIFTVHWTFYKYINTIYQ